MPSYFRELQYAFLQEKYAGEVEHHYPCIQRLLHEFDNPVMQSANRLQAILDSPDDQTAPKALSLFKRVIQSTQSFFVGTPNSTQRFSSGGSQVRLSSSHSHSARNYVTDLAIMDSSTSHSSLPALASLPLATTPARRLNEILVIL